MGETKERQVSFRLDDDTFATTQNGMKEEDLSLADFSRKLHKSALLLYRHFGSLSEFKKHVEKVTLRDAGTGGLSEQVPSGYIEALDQKVKSDAKKQAELERAIHARTTEKTKRRANNEREGDKAG